MNEAFWVKFQGKKHVLFATNSTQKTLKIKMELQTLPLLVMNKPYQPLCIKGSLLVGLERASFNMKLLAYDYE